MVSEIKSGREMEMWSTQILLLIFLNRINKENNNKKEKIEINISKNHQDLKYKNGTTRSNT